MPKKSFTALLTVDTIISVFIPSFLYQFPVPDLHQEKIRFFFFHLFYID